MSTIDTPISEDIQPLTSSGALAAETRRPDPAMLGKPVNPRIERDAYLTIEAPQVLSVLLEAVPITGPILEPCAGRGDLSVELVSRGLTVVSRDLIAHSDPLISGIELQDVMQTQSLAGFAWVVSNLPYNIQDQILAHLLPLAADGEVGVAILTRAAWHLAKARRQLVHCNPHFLGIVPLPRRPRWFEDGPHGPRHDFCWNVWAPRPRPSGFAPQIFRLRMTAVPLRRRVDGQPRHPADRVPERRGILWFTIRFLDGPSGPELQISIVVDGPPAMSLLVRRGLQVLDDWRRGTGTFLHLATCHFCGTSRGTAAARVRLLRWGVRSHPGNNAQVMKERGADVYAFTLMQSAEAGVAAKTALGTVGGAISWKPYDSVKWWWMHPCAAANNEEMERKLRLLSTRPELMIVAGAPIPGLNLSKPQLRRSNNSDANTNTLTNTPRGWLALDLDDISVPEPMGDADQLPRAAEFARDCLLPPEFRRIEMVCAATSSAGLKGSCTARLRLFCQLACEYPLETLRRWGRGAQIADVPIDPATLLPAQPIYTARPIFRGLDDPVPAGLRTFILPGPMGDRVPLVVDRYDAKAAAIFYRLRQVELTCGKDWRALLDQTVGGPEGYFEPLTRGIGIAVRCSATDDDLTEFVRGLLARRADGGRQHSYSRGWVLRTARNFRSLDSRAAAEIADLKNRLIRRH